MQSKDDPLLKKQEDIEERLKFKNYQTIKVLGQGSYGKVYQVKYIPNGKYYAFKLFKSVTNMEALFDKEVKALQKVQGVNQCVQLFAALDLINGKYRGFSMEYCNGGTLYEHIQLKRGFEVEDVRKYLREIVSVLEKLQSLRLAHLDIKVENILLDKNLNLILGDFGMCEEIPNGNVPSFRNIRGTLGYQLPEMVQQQPYCPFQADIFAAAVTVFILYSCTLPFQKKDKYGILFNNPDNFWKQEQKSSPNPDFQDNLNQDFVDLFTKMVHYDRNQRINLDQIKEHPFYIGISDSASSFSNTLFQTNSQLNHYTAPKSLETQTNQELTRSHSSELIFKFAVYEYHVKNLLTERHAEIYNEEAGRLCDFWTNIDCKTLFMYLFIHQEQFSSELPQLSDKQYKIKCIYNSKEVKGQSDAENPLEHGGIKFSISLQANQDNSKTYMLFTKKSGDSFEYNRLVAFIKDIVKNYT